MNVFKARTFVVRLAIGLFLHLLRDSLFNVYANLQYGTQLFNSIVK